MRLGCTAGRHQDAAPRQPLPVGSFGFAGMAGEAAARKAFEKTTAIRTAASTVLAIVVKQDLLGA